jgi:hypothetical protein
MSGFNAMTDDKQSMNRAEETHSEQRPPIVLTTLDRERLFALLHSALTTVDLSIARFLREEIERAEIVPDHVASLKNIEYKGYIHHATPNDPQYEIKSDKSDHIALHKSSALKLVRR